MPPTSQPSTFFKSIKRKEAPLIQWSECTLILPCIGVGNVAQLGMDLIINTLMQRNECHLAGRIYSDANMSCVGPNAYSLEPEPLLTNCEVYECPKARVVLLQRRAPCFKEGRDQFANELKNWIVETGFKNVVILASGFSEYLWTGVKDEEKFATRFLCTNRAKQAGLESQLELLHTQKLSPVNKYSLEPVPESEGGVYHLKGSGLLKRIFRKLDESNVSATALILFCSEGDNIPDALSLVNHLNSWIPLATPRTGADEVQWLEPVSWKNLFGERPPDMIY